MKKLFQKIDKSISHSNDRSLHTGRRHSLPANIETDLLYSGEQHGLASRGRSAARATELSDGSTDELSEIVSVRSLALSESDTLALTEPQHFELQESYQDNYTAYLPFLLRRLRIEQNQVEAEMAARNAAGEHMEAVPNSVVVGVNRDAVDRGHDPQNVENINAQELRNRGLLSSGSGSGSGSASDRSALDGSERLNGRHDVLETETDPLDDEKTIASRQNDRDYIMRRLMTSYNAKRSLIVVSEFIKSTTYVFPCAESYALFKELRLNKNKLQKRKNSVIVYDDKCNISRVTGASANSLALSSPNNAIVDRRQHIIPVDYKVKGQGLPVFKVSVPYMSSFRRKTPFMVFRKYREVPEKPSAVSGAETDEHFETYNFCEVHCKMFQPYKRYTFQFSPAGEAPFKVYAFQNNNRPFTDFNYKGSRFRVLGTLLLLAYVIAYNPELKLFILDELQASLADDLVEREHRTDFFSRSRHSSSGNIHEEAHSRINGRSSRNDHSDERTNYQSSSVHPAELQDPVPRPDNPIVVDGESYIRSSGQLFIPNDSPPFSRFVDSFVYQNNALFLPKKFTEVGKVEVYQNPEEYGSASPLTTYAVDTDSLVLTTILLALREANVRMAKRQHTGVTNRMSVFNSLPVQGPGTFFGAAVM